MTFSDEAPAITMQTGTSIACRGGADGARPAPSGARRCCSSACSASRRASRSRATRPAASTPSKPYFTAEDDLSDWAWVTINHEGEPGRPHAGDSALRPAGAAPARRELTLSLPRVGFYTTPAFLALWNTNDSNQHRVTVNQTLLVALGQSFTSRNAASSRSATAGLDADHAVAGGECVGCHKSLDPMRQFWGNQLDYNDRNDFPAGNRFTGAPANPRPTTRWAAGSRSATSTTTGPSMAALGALLTQVTDGARRCTGSRSRSRSSSASGPTRRRAATTDPEFRRIVTAFENSTPATTSRC